MGVLVAKECGFSRRIVDGLFVTQRKVSISRLLTLRATRPLLSLCHGFFVAVEVNPNSFLRTNLLGDF